MSQENVDLAWQGSRAWNDGGEEAVLQYLDADVEWHPPAESMEPGVYRGHDGVRDYLARLGEIFDAHVEPLEVIDVDNERVISVIRVIGRSEDSGIEINADWAWLITVGANKKGIRVETFTDKARPSKPWGCGADTQRHAAFRGGTARGSQARGQGLGHGKALAGAPGWWPPRRSGFSGAVGLRE